MCTAIHLSEVGLFGRTLDFERSFGESLVFTPREHMQMGEARNRYAILGVGLAKEGATLYYDGMNEWGLCGAALNFLGYAVYHNERDKKATVPSGIFLSFALGFCKSTDEIKALLNNISITGENVLGLPATPLHWIFADAKGAITVESTKGGLRVIDNPYGVLTNSPDFDTQILGLSDYMALHPGYPENRLTKTPLTVYSRGMGAVGLPGDFSSSSRFVRGVFVRENTRSGAGQGREINRMKHILSSVSVPYGCVMTEKGEAVSTIYSCIMDAENLTYYFSSYENPTFRGVKLYPEKHDSECYELYSSPVVDIVN